MSYLPGVPNAGPAPVSPMAGGMKASRGGPSTGIAKTAASVGKPGRTQHMGSLTTTMPRATPRTSVTGGDPMAHSMGQFGKSFSMPGSGMSGGSGVDPTQHAGVSQVKGGMGGMGRRIKQGALGPGKAGAVGPNATSGTSDTDMDAE